MVRTGSAAPTATAAAVVVTALMLFVMTPALAGPKPEDCKAERHGLVDACKQVLYGQSPSSQCCARARAAHVAECICPVITPKLAALVDVNRAVRLANGCGVRLPHHFKCGSITIP